MIDRERKLLFVHIARTGGTSVEVALVGNDWWEIDPLSKHLAASQARALYGEEVWNSFVKFSIVRNPWDRIVSMWATGWWNDGNEPDPSHLKEFITGLRPHPNEHYASLHYHQILDQDVDFILRFENLQSDFSSMLRILKLPDLRLPHVEGRRRNHYRAYFDVESASLVASMFETDVQRYDYTF